MQFFDFQTEKYNRKKFFSQLVFISLLIHDKNNCINILKIFYRYFNQNYSLKSFAKIFFELLSNLQSAKSIFQDKISQFFCFFSHEKFFINYLMQGSVI